MFLLFSFRERRKRIFKARDSYGQIFERVKNSKKDQSDPFNKQQNSSIAHNTSMDSNSTLEDVNAANALVPVQNQSGKDNHNFTGGSQQIVSYR